MAVLISVITPCYNHGEYLEDAVQSIPYSMCDYEIEHIIINDGSTDAATNAKCTELQQRGYTVIQQENKGLSAARNAGIAKATGKYILLLDADNILTDKYFSQAVDLLEKNNSYDIVYGDFKVFGNAEGVHKQGAFDISQMCMANQIDACALVRKSAMEKAGGYDTNMLLGCEDWDMWLNLYFSGSRFYYLEEICFHYRVTNVSMLENITRPAYPQIQAYLYNKYGNKVVEVLKAKINELTKYQRELIKYKKAEKTPIKSIAKLLIRKRIV